MRWRRGVSTGTCVSRRASHRTMSEPAPRIGIVKRSLTIKGHRTSVSLERAFWDGLCRIAAARALPIAALVAEIDVQRQGANLSSAIRVFVLETLADTALGAEPISAD